jgi:hypothetical protein
MNIAIETIQ